MLYYRYISVFEHIFVSINEWTNKYTKLKITEQSSTLFIFYNITFVFFYNYAWCNYNFTDSESNIFLLTNLTI